MKNKKIIYGAIFLLMIGIVSASTLFPIYVRNRPVNSIIELEINYSNDNSCSNILLSDVQNISIDNKGVGFMSSNISSLPETPSFICEYQDNVLRSVHEWNTKTFIGQSLILKTIELIETNNKLIINAPTIINSSLEVRDNLTATNITSTGVVRIQQGNIALILGADSGSTTITDETRKFLRVGMRHYRIGEEDIALIIGDSRVSDNRVSIGGGTSAFNSATEIRLFTAPTLTTTTGIIRLNVDKDGGFDFRNNLLFGINEALFGRTAVSEGSISSDSGIGLDINFESDGNEDGTGKFIGFDQEYIIAGVEAGGTGEMILGAELGKVHARGSWDFDKDLNVSGNITGNQIYGEMFNHTDAGNTISITDSTTYFNITDLEGGILNGFTFSNNALIPQVSGIYKFNWALAFGNVGNNVEYQITLKVNEIIINQCETHRKVGASGDVGSASGTCFLELVPNDEIRLGLKNIDGTQNAIIFNVNINAVRIGDIT